MLGDPGRGGEIVEWLLDRALVGLCAIQLGVAEEALRRTAEYTRTRKQFGRPIASFQGVALRAADAYIDLEAMRSTLLQAAWRVAEGLPGRAPRWRPPSGGPAAAASASSTPRSTCTAGSAPTSTIRSTASSCGRSSST